MFDYVKKHPIVTVIIIGVTLFVGGAVGELAHTLPQYLMWLGGGLAAAGIFAGFGQMD